MRFACFLLSAVALAACTMPQQPATAPLAVPPPSPSSAPAVDAPSAPPAAPLLATPPSGFTEQRSALRRAVTETLAEGRAVVSAADPRASDAGVEMLRRGGSAADAAAATLLALTVVEPQSSGIGGGGFLVYHDAATGRLVTLDGREIAPKGAGPDLFLGPDGLPLPRGQAVPGGKSVGVPGNVRLAAEMHQRWGKLAWAALFEPAIRLARDGFTVTQRLHDTIARVAADLSPTARALYVGPDGQPVAVGTRLSNPALAATLERIAKGGERAFYTGPIAEEIVAAVRTATRNPSALTLADLRYYPLVERAPQCGTYRAYRVCGMGPPSSGGIAVLQILKQIERFDLGALGPDNVLSWHLLAESERLAYADREAWIADPFFASVPIAGLTDPRYIAERSALIRIDRAMPSVTAGRPPGTPQPPVAAHANEVPATSHFAAVDARGNVASLTSTIEGPFGSGLMAAGFMLNNELTDFDLAPLRNGTPSPNRVQPGKRPRSSMSPTIVYGPDGAVVAAIGAAGGPTIIAQIAKSIIAVVDWKLPVGEAIALPNLMATGNMVLIEPGTRLESMAAALQALGHAHVRPVLTSGKANGLERVAGGWRGAADVRSEGKAAALR